ncbi:XLF-domain-containing protein [Mytilinidion resinicola]|uniref:Non-homologous end-joining factor 1 n=1 Tax=Mytilinidion resinicola TaxID=574789 RepID=A0A6A6YVC8_9PEZI|nr:XLF-domain-containing protein [Mytilinidion resinicola]KAF2812892.1 XLF-domain-containing protein [Mytilinidion resinicola]
MEASAWVRLRISNAGPRAPPLFLKTSFISRKYTIYVTDLSRVWSEQLDEHAIKERGTSEDNHFGNIDESNFADLLETVASALEQSNGNSHKIIPEGTDELILQAKLVLPEPLDPFNWKFHLELLSSEDISKQLTLPLLASSFTHRSQINDLVHNLQEKDKVISRLLDQLDSINVGLSTVFPSITGLRASKKTIKRDQAAKHVPGLRTFNEDEWRSTSRLCTVTPSTIDEVMENMATDVHVGLLGDVEIGDQDNLWWTHLSEFSQSKEVAGSTKAESIEDEAMETEDDGDEFQRQATPPHLKKTETRENVKSNFCPHQKNHRQDLENEDDSGDETTEDEDLDAPPKAIKQEPLSQNPTEHITKLNIDNQVPVEISVPPKPRSRFTIGKPKKAPTLESTPQQEQADAIPSLRGQPVSDESAPTRGSSIPPKPARSRFKIGGKKDDATHSRGATLSRTPDPHAVVDHESSSGRSMASTTKPRVLDDPPQDNSTGSESKVEAAPLKPKARTPEPETAEEIADRRRRELKRFQETKPAPKKKRRL